MGYEDSRACKMLATHCACCSKPLVDAESVNTGMGPICRDKHGYADGPNENRVRANKLVYEIAALQNGDAVAAKVKELHELGFTKLANRIVARLSNIIRIEKQAKEWWVWAPFRSGLTFAWNNEVPGSVWDRQLKLRRVPLKAGGALRAFLLKHLLLQLYNLGITHHLVNFKISSARIVCKLEHRLEVATINFGFGIVLG